MTIGLEVNAKLQTIAKLFPSLVRRVEVGSMMGSILTMVLGSISRPVPRPIP